MNRLIEAIATDLNTKKYEHETESQYHNRLMYCAIHAWIYANAVSDIRVNGEEKPIDVDIMSIMYGVARVLDDYLILFPNSKEFFLSTVRDKQISPYAAISMLLHQLYLCNAIGKTSARRYSNIPLITNDFNPLYLERGGNNFLVCKDNNLFYAGIGRWYTEKPENIESTCEPIVFGFNNIPINKWILQIGNNSQWSKQRIGANVFIYIPCGRAHGLKHWRPYKETLVSKFYFSIIRDEFYRFFLCRNNNGIIEISVLNDWYNHSREIHRMLFGLDYLHKKPPQYAYNDFGDSIRLRLYSYLPPYEQAIISYCGWPENHADDKFNYTIDIRTWAIVKQALEKLGIVLYKENSNG